MPEISRSQMLIALSLCAALLCSFVPLRSQTRSASPSTAVATASSAPQQENTRRVQDIKFFSKALQREMQYRVVLPKDYFSTENRYPVLYLLHGLTGHYRSFEAHSNLTRYLERYQLIAVSIEGENSWYINSATNPKEKWEDYFLQDVLTDVGRAFPHQWR